jgi:4-aminobutyrate aminotransferase-like enzyme
VLRVMPPMVVTSEDVRHLAEVMSEVLREVRNEK